MSVANKNITICLKIPINGDVSTPVELAGNEEEIQFLISLKNKKPKH